MIGVVGGRFTSIGLKRELEGLILIVAKNHSKNKSLNKNFKKEKL
jgi:hypothetical protein